MSERSPRRVSLWPVSERQWRFMLARLVTVLVALATASAFLAARGHTLAEHSPSSYAAGLSLYRMDSATARRALDAIDSLSAFGLVMPDELTLVAPLPEECDAMVSAGNAAETVSRLSFVERAFGSGAGSVVQFCDGWSDVVMVHELTHAWDNARLSDSQRADLQRFFAAPTWNDQSYDWSQRGSERLAECTVDCVLGFQPPDSRLCVDLQAMLESLNTPGNTVYAAPSPGWETQVSLLRIDMIGH